MKAAVYNRYLHSMGGGERHSGMLAQVLAEDGHEVDLVGHEEVAKEILADHLGLDLAKVSLRIVPDYGDDDLVGLSAQYDLFVNASYMSQLAPRAAHNLYLCYFPTPPDHDLEPWRRFLIRHLGPQVRNAPPGIGFGTGWFPPEGGRRRSWSWSGGRGILVVPPRGGQLAFDLGRPGAPGAVEVSLVDERGVELARLTAAPDRFRHHRIQLPELGVRQQLLVLSDTFQPGVDDPRHLGAAVSRIRLIGARRGPREWLAQRFPWLLRDPSNRAFLQAYERVLANSEYTRGWIRRLWGIDSDVLFPPIPVQDLEPGDKQRRILTVGRFFARGRGHSKKQLEQVQAFGRMVRRGGLDGWELHVAGGCEAANRPYLEQVVRAADGLPVHVHANASRRLVEELFASSSIFWAATGLGEDDQRAPWAFEHFGITTVEAMAAGCVPVVIDKAGHREVVRHGIDGYRWQTLAELEACTRRLAADPALRARLAAAARERAQDFSEAAFARRWREIAAGLHLPG